MKKLIFLLSLTALALLIAPGCGDDDCPNCPSDVDTVVLPQEFLAWVDGYIQLDPYTLFEAYVFANGGANPFVDSIAVGDSVIYYDYASYWWHESDPYFYFNWVEEQSAPYMYESGDLATVTLWGSNMSSSASVVVLDYEADEAVMMVPSGTDTLVQYGNDMEFAWSRIANAEWYGVELNYDLDSSGTTIMRNYYYYTYDTTFTVPDTVLGYAVENCEIWALPTTGPDPESGFGNWEGDFAAGKLYSIGDYAYGRVAYFVVTGKANPAISVAVTRPTKSAREIADGVYNAYR